MWTINEYKMTDERRMTSSQNQGDTRAPPMSDQRYLAQPQRSHAPYQVFRHRHEIIAPFGLIALPMPTLIKCDDQVLPTEVLCHQTPRIRRCA
jgi:hypothetical protein